jgi:hypothetical protein
VGFPEGGPARTPEPGEPQGMTDAHIAYLNDRGSAAQNIPPRPFLEPGVESVMDAVVGHMGNAAQAALDGNPWRWTLAFRRPA